MFKTKKARAIDACIDGIVKDPPMAWIIFRPSIGHVAIILQNRLRAQGIELSFKAACRKVEKYKRRRTR